MQNAMTRPNLSHEARAAIMTARLAPTMGEAARIYFAAIDRAGATK